MVAQKITCPSRSDDIGKHISKSNTKRYGFFKFESQNSQYFESGRHRSFNGREESAGRKVKVRGQGRASEIIKFAAAGDQSHRGKIGAPHEFLKTEPVFEGTMFQESDCEFFQDLGLWCSPDKEDQIPIIDEMKTTEERALNTHTPNIPFSPQGWEVVDANSPLATTGFYSSTPKDFLSPNMQSYNFMYPDLNSDKQEQFMDISSLPVVIGDLASDDLANTNQLLPDEDQHSWINTQDKKYTQPHTHNYNHNLPFIDQEDSLGCDTKYINWSDAVFTSQTNANDVLISEYIINDQNQAVATTTSTIPDGKLNLKLDIPSRAPFCINDPVITTPDIVHFVEQLEKEKFHPLHQMEKKPVEVCQPENTIDLLSNPSPNPPPMEYDIITPKTESHIDSDCEEIETVSLPKRKRKASEDSDETYTPYIEKVTTPRKYKRRKPNIPIKDMIVMLEGNQQQNKARRGRPPKRRESTVSSVCSIDDTNSSVGTTEYKYRELRDKNNEASKRSRMNRKLKELQMEQMAMELEERNKKLKVRADILEEMTKRLKDTLMTAILQK